MFSLFAKPWKASDPKSEKFIGIGAFNMLKSSVYEAIGTHYAIRMRPDDDMKLGKLVKKHGFRQELLQGKDLLCVEWYASASEMVRGLEKNSFAGIDYSLITVLFAAISQITLFIWPFFALIFTEGATQIVNTAIVLTTIFMYLGSSTVSGTRRYYSFAFPIAAALFTFIILNSTVKTLVNNGISWRGTHYPLSELKANKV
ncbi:MAG: glycosyl transferase, partial [Blastocatellia bacterium]|nr:glycosyl transferase [Blastocatellia bacterium]